MEFKEWLRMKILENNFTQEAFGSAVGVSGPAVNHWLIGKHRPSINKAIKIAEILNTPQSTVLSMLGYLKPIEKEGDIKYKVGKGESTDEKLLRLSRYFPEVFLDKFDELDEDEKLDIIDIFTYLLDKKRKEKEGKK